MSIPWKGMNIEPNFSHNFFKCLQYLFIPRRDMQVLEELFLCILLHEKFCMDISVLHKFIFLMYSNQIFWSHIASIRERLDIIEKYHYHYTFLLYWIINVYITKTHNLSFRCLYLRHHAFVLNNKYMVVRFWYIVHNLIHIRARAFIMRRIAENARKPKSDIWGI